MGLDQYLNVQIGLWGATEHSDKGTRNDLSETLVKAKQALESSGAFPLPFPDEASYERPHLSEVIVRLGYWRKANAIHHWFISNCANGEDDCRPVSVDVAQLVELRSACLEVTRMWAETDDPAVRAEFCADTLPVQGGFFFGSTEYDEDYYEDIQHTVNVLNRAIDFYEANAPHSLSTRAPVEGREGNLPLYFEYLASW